MINESATTRLKKQEKKKFRLLLVFVFFFCIAYFNFVSRAYYLTLNCSQSDNQCVLEENHIFDNGQPDKRTFLLSDVEEMRLHTNNKQQHRIYMYVNSEPIPIDQDWTNEHYTQQTEAVAAFHRFLKSGTEDVFFYRLKTTADFKRAVVALGVFFVLLLIVLVVYSRCRNQRLWMENQEKNV